MSSKAVGYTYNLSTLWVFVHEGRSSDMVPHLSRCHCKDDGLKQQQGKSLNTDQFPERRTELTRFIYTITDVCVQAKKYTCC